jgi:hypothetical protein
MGNHRRITMITQEQKDKEKDFNSWLESIVFVDKEGRIINPTLTKDKSEDFDGDREEG